MQQARMCLSLSHLMGMFWKPQLSIASFVMERIAFGCQTDMAALSANWLICEQEEA